MYVRSWARRNWLNLVWPSGLQTVPLQPRVFSVLAGLQIALWNCFSYSPGSKYDGSKNRLELLWYVLVLSCNDYQFLGVWVLGLDLRGCIRTWQTPIAHHAGLVGRALELHILKDWKEFMWYLLTVMPASLGSPFQHFTGRALFE